MKDQAERRCQVIPNLDAEIQFKTSLETQGLDESTRIVIRAEKTPTGQHKGRFNAPAANEIAVLMTNQQAGSRDIVVKMRSNDPKDMIIINEGHIKYYSMQYPLILWK